jgi:LysR family transcriptional regulator, glycine cleavage system transcriptional activator
MRLPRQALIDGLRAFAVAAKELSFKTAADALFLTPSAVSHRIRDLEKHLGARLFVRKTRAIELTEAGRSLLAEVDPLLTALDSALDRAAKRTRRRTLRIAAPPFLANELLIPRLASFYGLQPRLDVDIQAADTVLDEHHARADVSIIIRHDPPNELVATELFRPRFVAATARSVALVARELGAKVFDKYRRIVYSPRAGLWSDWAQAAAIPVAPSNMLIQVDTLPGAVSAAERGLGIALVPTFVCERSLRPGRFLRINEVEIVSEETYYVVYRSDDRTRPDVRAFLSWALTELKR